MMPSCSYIMKSASEIIFVGLLLVSSLASSWAKLPFQMKPCARNATDLGDCTLEMASRAMSYILNGRSEIFGKLDSIPLNDYNFKSEGSDVAIHVKAKSMWWKGMNTAIIKNFRFDLASLELFFELVFPALKFEGTCTVNGRVNNVGIYADGVRFPLASLSAVESGFSASFGFQLERQTNASGTFLVSKMTAYDPRPGEVTWTLDNFLPPTYTPDHDATESLQKVKDQARMPTKDLLSQFVGQAVPQSLSKVLQLATYDQFFPVTVSAEDLPDGAPTLKSGWLPVTLALCSAMLLKIA
ncbi:uncharacterized protein LOC134541162 [Bacillus rossius redtenbacheri]|uniref:uncharacterized protein LOC134541162 n=1 Tax=Bacillus rossius redtenbacheri TaxID=93214 RepID=UPI002FDDE554